MSFLGHLKAARAIGAGDCDAAIAAYERELRGGRKDVLALTMIAQCYEWKGDMENAIKYADRALSVDPNDFRSLALAARYWHSVKDEGRTYLFTCRILDNLPEPLPEIPKIVFIALKSFAFLPKPLSNLERRARTDFSALAAGDRQVVEWACDYKHWYETKRNDAHGEMRH